MCVYASAFASVFVFRFCLCFKCFSIVPYVLSYVIFVFFFVFVAECYYLCILIHAGVYTHVCVAFMTWCLCLYNIQYINITNKLISLHIFALLTWIKRVFDVESYI